MQKLKFKSLSSPCWLEKPFRSVYSVYPHYESYIFICSQHIKSILGMSDDSSLLGFPLFLLSKWSLLLVGEGKELETKLWNNRMLCYQWHNLVDIKLWQSKEKESSSSNDYTSDSSSFYCCYAIPGSQVLLASSPDELSSSLMTILVLTDELLTNSGRAQQWAPRGRLANKLTNASIIV